MATVTLPSPLRELAGGQGRVEVDGATVGEVIRTLQSRYPRLEGWVLDERGAVRQHVNVFVNGERLPLDTAVDAGDLIHVLPAISGGSVDTMTAPRTHVDTAALDDAAELLIGTKKGSSAGRREARRRAAHGL